MVASMALSVKQPRHSPSRGGPPDHYHQFGWLLKADKDSKVDSGHGVILSPDESSNSWEARAFAEDASSLAAGIWPPRAYPCSFCRREFRSAQALGGHMNVHRRDRARLRQSSPPPPFRATHNIPLQSSSIIYKSQHEYSSTGLNPPKIYPNESLSKVNMLPTNLSFSAMSPQSSTASLADKYPSDMAASFPLRLHLLASEAASTLMLPQAESSDLLSLWPTSALDSVNGCHSTVGAGIKGSAIDISSWSVSSCTSSTSTVLSCDVARPSIGATPCRRVSHSAPDIQPEDESPKKKSNVTKNSDFQPYQIIKLTNSSMNDGISHAHGKQNLGVSNVADESICIERGREASSAEFIDLELRLGQRAP